MESQLLPMLRNEYLDCHQSLSDLGFLSLFLGGSASCLSSQSEVINFKADWDGLGIVARKKDVISLIGSRRAELSRLLNIEKEDGSTASWEAALEQASSLDWQLVRFSGWTSSGSKRTLKIWSEESLSAAMATREWHFLGVLSHKTLQNVPRAHPKYGPVLFITQPKTVKDGIYIMPDYDFSKPVTAGKEARMKSWPGVACDLLLTSKCLFEASPGLGLTQKALVWSKWLAVNQTSSCLELLPWLYRWSRFSSTYKEILISEIDNLKSELRPLAPVLLDHPSGEGNKSVVAFVIYPDPTESPWDCYQVLHFEPATHQTWDTNSVKAMDASFSASSQYSIVAAQNSNFEVHAGAKLINTPFSRNSVGKQGSLRFVSSSIWLEVFMKFAQSFREELLVMPYVQTYFPHRSVQQLVAVDESKMGIFYEFFHGKSLLDIRFRQLTGNADSEGFKFEANLDTQKFLLTIESRRAQDVMHAYRLSCLPALVLKAVPGMKEQQRIHKYFYDRVHNNAQLLRFYSHGATFLNLPSGRKLSLEEFLSIPLRINGIHHSSPGTHFTNATNYLSPEAKHFTSFPFAFGLGDGHGGNLMVGDPTMGITVPELRYIDYEVAGWHPFVLDLAKPIYLDCFYNLLWADLLCEDLSTSSIKNGPRVSWQLGEKLIEIEYDIQVSFLDKALATTKLEYVVRPIFEMLSTVPVPPELFVDTEKALGYALLCCAVLTRNFPTRADCWFLNLAVGVRLAVNMKGTLEEMFGWRRWPEKREVKGDSEV